MALKAAGSGISIDSDPCILAWDGKLFVGAEDGYIWTFDGNLSAGESWQAHAVQPFALAVQGDKVYSASNDGAIKIWTKEGTKVTELPSTGGDVGTLKIFGQELYAGDESGHVTIFVNNEVKASHSVLEEVKDLELRMPFLFTVKDLDVTVTEIKSDGKKTHFVSKHIMEGRAPMALTGSYLLVMARDGNTLRLHSASVNTTFKKLHEIKVSDMIVTSLSVNADYVWTGGWDGTIRRWQIVDDKLKAAGELALGSCVNAIVATAPDIAYAGLAGGKLLNIKAT